MPNYTAVWNELHLIAINYPQDPTKTDKFFTYSQILHIIDNKITCPSCKATAIDYIFNVAKLHNSIDKGKDSLERYFFDFHNYINTKLKKPIFTWEEYQTVLRKVLMSGTTEVVKTTLPKQIDNSIDKIVDIAASMFGNFLVDKKK